MNSDSNDILMKNILLNVLIAAAVISTNGIQAQQTKILSADKHNEYGLVYTLPTTALRIEVNATREIHKAGPYFQYAKRYIGTDKVIKEDSESWTINAVKVTPYGIPDKEKRYLMQLKSGATTYIGVDADGMLLSINKAPETPPASVSSFKDTPAEKINVKEYLQYVNEDFIASQSSAKQAQMLSESLMEIRDAKISLTRGTAETMPTDGKQLELMLNSLSHQEAAITGAFLGFTEKETVTRVFTFIPNEDNEKKILFRMSDFAGFVDADDLSGDPVYITANVVSEGELPKDAKGEEKKLPKDAVIYMVPGTAGISVSHLGKTLFSGEFEFSQFGMEFGLNPNLFSSKKDRSWATFDPSTGGLTRIAIVNEE